MGDRPRGGLPDQQRRGVTRAYEVWPEVPEHIKPEMLDAEVRKHDLRTLSVENADWVARHLVMCAELIDSDPALALRHAQAAVSRSGRVAAVREAAGIAAYRAGEYAKALTELRAARRLSGSDDQLPVIADCERGLGRPDRALEIAGSPSAAALSLALRIEMRIVAAGARQDLGQPEAAVVTLEIPELSVEDKPWAARLRYAYADALAAANRTTDAGTWFAKAADVDQGEETDAEERLAELHGVVMEVVHDDGPQAEDDGEPGPDDERAPADRPSA